jgi:hypothetical protein
LLMVTAFLWVAGREDCQTEQTEYRQTFQHDGGNVS